MPNLSRYLVYYFNGLVETNIMVIAPSEDVAKSYVEDNLKDEDFVNNQCYGKECYVTKVEVLS